VGELLHTGGKRMAFAEAFANPPRSTHEVIHPEAYLNHERIAQLTLPDVRSILGDKYEIYDSGTIGELDVRALLRQFGPRKVAEDLSKGWRGGVYVTVNKKSSLVSTTVDLAMLYVSRWSSPEAAMHFAKFYADTVTSRYQSVSAVSGGCSVADCPTSSTQQDTEEGPVIVELWPNNTVIISETFDKDVAAKLSAAVRHSETKAIHAFQVIPNELGARLYDLSAFRNFQKGMADGLLNWKDDLRSPPFLGQ